MGQECNRSPVSALTQSSYIESCQRLKHLKISLKKGALSKVGDALLGFMRSAKYNTIRLLQRNYAAFMADQLTEAKFTVSLQKVKMQMSRAYGNPQQRCVQTWRLQVIEAASSADKDAMSKEAAKARMEMEIALQLQHQQRSKFAALKQMANHLRGEAKGSSSAALFVWKFNRQRAENKMRSTISSMLLMAKCAKRNKEARDRRHITTWRTNCITFKRAENAVNVVCTVQLEIKPNKQCTEPEAPRSTTHRCQLLVADRLLVLFRSLVMSHLGERYDGADCILCWVR